MEGVTIVQKGKTDYISDGKTGTTIYYLLLGILCIHESKSFCSGSSGGFSLATSVQMRITKCFIKDIFCKLTPNTYLNDRYGTPFTLHR